ncbi:site-2 protease family protein [bacterium]|nr:site-2 protease family protein [bacterium]
MIDQLQYALAAIISIIPAIALHEFGHAAMADKLGDPTPRSQGRMTVNPAAHFDPIGLIMILVTIFAGFGLGWGKPVLTNPMYFKDRRKGLILVAIAGPLMNLCLACLTVAISYIMYMAGLPLYGFAQILITTFLLINIGLILFNMLPIPPLDGGNVLINLLPWRTGEKLQRLAPYGLLIILALMYLRILGPLLGGMRMIILQGIGAGFGMDYIAWLFGFSG